MNPPIKIMAEPQQHNPNICKFTVEQPVYPGGFARFVDAQRAKGSALAETLFAIEGVNRVEIGENIISITKNTSLEWRAMGPAIGAAIRAHLQSGLPAVSPELQDRLPQEDKLRSRIQRILDEQINPAVASHGGVISLMDVQGTRVFLKMGGGCQGCGQATVTLREGVEKAIRQQVPEVSEILDTSDHAAGTNPYYAPASH